MSKKEHYSSINDILLLLCFFGDDILYFCYVKQKGLKYKVRKKIICRAVKNNHRTVLFPSPQSIRSIGVVREVDSAFGFHSSKLAANLRIVFLNLMREKAADEQADNTVSSADLNFWSLPVRNKIEPFVSEPFDLLINFTGYSDDLVDYICAKSVARFKASTVSSGNIYDLVISQQKFNGPNFIDELKNAFSNFNTLS